MKWWSYSASFSSHQAWLPAFICRYWLACCMQCLLYSVCVYSSQVSVCRIFFICRFWGCTFCSSCGLSISTLHQSVRTYCPVQRNAMLEAQPWSPSCLDIEQWIGKEDLAHERKLWKECRTVAWHLKSCASINSSCEDITYVLNRTSPLKSQKIGEPGRRSSQLCQCSCFMRRLTWE